MINGTKEEVAAQWNGLDPETVERALIRHCSALEMPPSLQAFSQLQVLKVYNSSIAEWARNAALTRACHPDLESLFFARVNLSDGGLPVGLQSPEFPPSLIDIELSTTNLRTLPDDLDTKWPKNEYFCFLGRSLCGNPIDETPPELFAVESIFFLHTGDNASLKALPADATMSSSMGQIFVSNTKAAFFPSWVDAFVHSALTQRMRAFIARGTPYCEHMAPVYNRSLSDADAMAAVRATMSPTAATDTRAPSILMDTSASNRDVVRRAVSCEPGFDYPFFPLATEDEQSALR